MKNIFTLLMLVYGCTAALGQTTNNLPCPKDISITHSITGMERHQASQIIEATAQLTEQADVTFTAGNKIRLTKGFRAVKGSCFHAFLSDCKEPPTPSTCINGQYRAIESSSRVGNQSIKAISTDAIELGYIPNQVVVKCRTTISSPTIEKLKRELKVEKVIPYPTIGLEVWELADNQPLSTPTICDQYSASSSIITIEPNYICQASQSFDTIRLTDPDFGKQWGLHNYGQTGGAVDADIDALEAWSNCSGTEKINVAIIDSGVDFIHPDLMDNIWQNLGEDADGDGVVMVFEDGCWRFDPDDENGIDDDGNGYVDDFVGWDFINNDNNPFDGSGHGTHVAGIIGAVSGNGIGIHGVTNNVNLIPLKILDDDPESPTGSLIHAIEAIDYCIKNKIPISNNSWIGETSVELKKKFKEAEEANHLLIMGAGNKGADLDTGPIFSTSSDLDNILVVAGTDKNDQLINMSNYGINSVDLAAPGAEIYSTLPHNTYDYRSGTSMAAPFVTGACVHYWSQDASSTYHQVKDAVLNTVDILPGLQDKVSSSGRLNMGNLCRLPCSYNDSLTLVIIYEEFKKLGLDLPWDLTQPMLTWKGVEVDATLCKVIGLDLSNGGWNTSIPVEIVRLSQLKNLDLEGNNFYGTFPADFKKFCDSTIDTDFTNNPCLNDFSDFCKGVNTQILIGDANSDRIVDKDDLLYWGLANGTTGCKRSTSIVDSSNIDFCFYQIVGPDWDNPIDNNFLIDAKHSDANGDGRVDSMDFFILKKIYDNDLCLENNIAVNNAPKSSNKFKITEPTRVLHGDGYGTRIALYLQDENGKPTYAHGIASTLDLSNVNVKGTWQNDITLVLDSSSLDPDKYLFKYDLISKSLDLALTRTDKKDKLCIGPVGFIVIAEIIAIGDEVEVQVRSKATKIVVANSIETVNGNDLIYPTQKEIEATSETINYWTTISHYYCDPMGAIEFYITSKNPSFSIECVRIYDDNHLPDTILTPTNITDSVYQIDNLVSGTYEVTFKSDEVIKKDTFIIKNLIEDEDCNELISNKNRARLNNSSQLQQTARDFGLQILPNPTQSVGTIQYEVPTASAITLSIYDKQGRLRKVLMRHSPQIAGQHQHMFDTDELEEGLYLLNLQTDKQIVTKKFFVLR